MQQNFNIKNHIIGSSPNVDGTQIMEGFYYLNPAYWSLPTRIDSDDTYII